YTGRYGSCAVLKACSEPMRHGWPLVRGQTVWLVTGMVTASPVAASVVVMVPLAVVTARSSAADAQPLPGVISIAPFGSLSQVANVAAMASPSVAAGRPGTTSTAPSA